MSRPTQAKYCPQCHAMNFREAETCVHCGHQFRTGVAEAPASPPPDELHRTQMFTLPPVAPRAAAPDTPSSITGRRAGLASWLVVFRTSSVFPILLILAAVVVALLVWAVAAFR